MSYQRSIASGFAIWRPIEDAQAGQVVKSLEAFIRSHGKSLRELAELHCQRHRVHNVCPTEIPERLGRDRRPHGCDVRQIYSRMERDAAMPVMTPIVTETLGMVRVLLADGGIGLLQGDSGTGKTEAVRAVALKHERAIVVQASTARARPKPMLGDIGRRMSVSYYCRDTGNTYRMVRERLPCFDLLVIDEVHTYGVIWTAASANGMIRSLRFAAASRTRSTWRTSGVA